jgi:catechol 2,3-dioxygenase-like lactoylglutathione lyase family enzyme
MAFTIGSVALLVPDYDEAIAFYVDAVGLALLEDTEQGEGRRWVVVGPGAGHGTSLIIAKADTPEQIARIGDQTGGRVGFFLHTDDFTADHARMAAKGVRFLEEPRHEVYGSVAVFEDHVGNRWDLIQPAARETTSAQETTSGQPSP